MDEKQGKEMTTSEKKMVDEEQIDPKQVPYWTSCRFVLALIGFLGFVNLYALRINLSVSMVCMINQTALDLAATPENSTLTPAPPSECRPDSSNDTQKDGEFEWDKETQGIILGAFFWGYLVTQIPGGWLAERFGGKGVYGWFMLMTAVATLLTPVGARASPWLLVALRVVQGLGEGVVFPAMHCMWAKWAPPLERSKLIGFTYAGAQIGNVITLPISGVLCDSGFDGGWPSIFYVFGSFGVLWFILWMVLAYDEPAEHPRITEVERKYIEQSIGATKELDRKTQPTPWKTILTSLPVWAIVLTHTCANWGTYTLLTNIPTYMSEVLQFDMVSNGLYSAIPYICFWLFINVAGFVADTLRSNGWKTEIVRKIMNTMGTVLPGAFLIGTGYISCHQPHIAVVLLSIGVGLSGFQYGGFIVNHVDIAPPFAGSLFGLSNTAATLPGILAPYAIGVITEDQTQSQWQTVFYIAAGIYLVGAIFFLVFGRGEIQEWVYPYMYEDDISVQIQKAKEKEALEDGKLKEGENNVAFDGKESTRL